MTNVLRLALRLFVRSLGAAVILLVVVPILCLCEPFRRIRLDILVGNRICHLAANLELIMRRLQLDGEPRNTTHIFFVWNPSNRQILTMWQRHFWIIESRLLCHVMTAAMPILKKTRFIAPYPWHDSDHREWTLGKPTLEFTASEEARGSAALRSLGIEESDWFICFQSRDPSYERSRNGFGAPSLPFWSNRDCHIENYLGAVEFIASQGGYALRMGAIVDTPILARSPRVIDYATGHRDDFLDIYVLAKCRFFLGNTSGLLGVPLTFNRPLAVANYCPFAVAGLGRTTLYIPKLLRRISDGRFLTFQEIRELGLMGEDIKHQLRLLHSSFYRDYGLEWVENDVDDIIDLCKDMLDQLEGRRPSVEAGQLQDDYRSLYTGPHTGEYSGRIGPRFILKYRYLLSSAPADSSHELPARRLHNR